MITRHLEKAIRLSLKSNKSVLLIGPRQTGKSTLIKKLKPDFEFNLAHEATFLNFVRDPQYLESVLSVRGTKAIGLVFIDEVQRVASVLNTVQWLIDEKKGFVFALTGSSARKLKRGRANLLPGRIHSYELGPITCAELETHRDDELYLRFGSLPEVVTDPDVRQVKKLLRAYSMTYLNEEIKAEALTKNIEGFTRFLFCLAADSTKFLDLSKISRQTAVPRQTVGRFFEILEDTLIVKRLDSFARTEKKRLVQHPRFFFFDNGVLNSLLGNYTCSLDRKGFLFENLFFNQLSTHLSYSEHDYRLSTYRTEAGAEVDFVLELNDTLIAIEAKSANFSGHEMGGFASLERYVARPIRKVVVTLEPVSRAIDGVEVIYWQDFIKSIA
jgi:predicted AAA+ superfamily ATPase